MAKDTLRSIWFRAFRVNRVKTCNFLNHMSANFDIIAGKLERWGSDYSTAYERVGGKHRAKCKAELIRIIEDIVGTMEFNIRSLHDYVHHELNFAEDFRKAPKDSIVRLGKSSEIMFFTLGQILISLSSQSQMDILRIRVRKKISNANWKMLEISTVMNEFRRASDRPEVQRAFEGVGHVCSSIPITLGKLAQQCTPDQVVRQTNAPCPFKEADDESETMGSFTRTESHGGVQMHLNWTRCLGEFWCKFNNVNLEHEHFDYCRGVYIIWHGSRDPGVVYVGQGDIKARIQDHRSDPAIQRFEPRGLYVTWAEIPESSRDGVESFLAKKWTPKVGTDHPSADPIEVNSPWD